MSNGGMVVHGQVEDPEIGNLRKTVQDQRRRIADLENDRDNALSDSAQTKRALESLRKSLSPVYRALQMVFGDLDAAGVTEDAPSSAPDALGDFRQGSHDAVWEAWKERLPGYPAKVIDALLAFGSKSAPQLAVAVGCRRERIYEAVAKLKSAGVVVKVGENYSLKKL